MTTALLSAAVSPPASDLRTRFIDNDAPVVFSFKAGGGDAERKLRRLVGWPAEWIGYDVDTPDAGAIVRAESVIDQLQQIAASDGSWQEPHVCAGHDGEIVLEWWRGQKKTTLYVSANTIECIRVWGPDIDTQMDESTLDTSAQVEALWNWLRSD